MSDYKPAIGRRVRVYTGDLVIDGTLTSAGRDCLTVTDAHGEHDADDPRPIDGQAIIPHLSVQWVQVL